MTFARGIPHSREVIVLIKKTKIKKSTAHFPFSRRHPERVAREDPTHEANNPILVILSEVEGSSRRRIIFLRFAGFLDKPLNDV